MKNIKLYEEFESNIDEGFPMDPDMIDNDDDSIDEKKDPSAVDSKDKMRVEDIMNKAGGDWNYKAEQLTRQMAKAITDGAKALRRGKAAIEQGYNEMAIIFLLKAGALGVSY